MQATPEAPLEEKNKVGVENSGEGIKPLPQKRLWTPPTYDTIPLPFVHAMSFSLQETGTDQTNPTFLMPPKLGLEGALYSTFSEEDTRDPTKKRDLAFRHSHF